MHFVSEKRDVRRITRNKEKQKIRVSRSMLIDNHSWTLYVSQKIVVTMGDLQKTIIRKRKYKIISKKSYNLNLKLSGL